MQKTKFFTSLGAIIIVAGLGSLFVNLGLDWFSTLEKPNEWVPNLTFPIVWSIIYFLFVISLYFLAKQNLFSEKISIFLIINGVLNILWCLIFFTLNQLFLGLIIIILNLIFGFILVNKMGKFSYFLIIYPIWLSLATCLNLAVWILN